MIDANDPRVIWRRAFRAGKFDAMTGPVTLTPEMIAGAVKAFGLARDAGVLPVIVYDHVAKATEKVALGHVIGMELREDGWVWCGMLFQPPQGHPEYADWVSRLEAAFRAGTIADVSVEVSFGVKNVAYYGTWTAPAEVTAVAVLPPGDFPAIPGAGRDAEMERTCAGCAVFRAGTYSAAADTEPAAEAATDEERRMEEKIAALTSRVEAIETAVKELVASVKALTDSAAAARKAQDDAATEAEVTAARAKLADRMVAGAAENVDKALAKLDGPARLAVLATLDATLPAKLGTGKTGERFAAGTGQGEDDKAPKDGEAAIAFVMERDKLQRPQAVLKAISEYPKLFADPEPGAE